LENFDPIAKHLPVVNKNNGGIEWTKKTIKVSETKMTA
jgi:hypothetical protein